MIAQETLDIPVIQLINTKIEFWALVEEYLQEPKMIQTMMGMLCTQIYGLCKRWDVFTEVYEKGTSKKIRLINRERLLALAGACEMGLGLVSNAVTWTSKFLKMFWPKAFYCPKVIRRLRHLMMDEFKLFAFTPGIKGETVSPPDLHNANLVRMLLLYETLEAKLISLSNPQTEQAIYETPNGWVGELSLESGRVIPGATLKEIIPGEERLDCLGTTHGGALMREIYNSLFGKDYREYMRPEPDTVFVRQECDTQAIKTPHPETVELPPTRQIIPVWKKEFKLSEWSWRSMLSKMWNVEMVREWLSVKEEELLYPVF